MAINSGKLVQELLEGGLTPMAAKAIANAVANAASPQFSLGGDTVDVTPTESMRLVDGDARKYELTNLDYSPSQPFADRIAGLKGSYESPKTDHPYKDSQPRVSTNPLSSAPIKGSDYIEVTPATENNAGVSTVSLKLRRRGGNQLRINEAAQAVESVPLRATSNTPKFLAAEVRENEENTEIVLTARALEQVNVVLADGSTRQMTAWPAGEAASNAAFTPYAFTNLLQATSPQQVRQNIQAPVAWVRFTGSTAAVLGSYNVLNVQRFAAGDYQVNFASPLADDNYAAIATCTQRGGGGGPGNNFSIGYGSSNTASVNSTYTANACRFYAQRADGAGIDPASVSVVFFR
jgi:hypothetical protein